MAVALEHAPDVLADAAETAQDDVLAPGERRIGGRLARHGGRQGRARAGFAQQPARDALVVPDRKWREHHAERDRGQQRLHEGGVDVAVVDQQREQCEAEFPAGTEHQAGTQRLEPAVAVAPRDGHHDRGFQHHESGHERRDEGQVAHQQAQVEQHADRDEEQAEQHVAERADDGLDLVPVFGLGEQHAGEKGAERERQADAVGDPGRGQRDQQHREREQLVAPVTRDLEEQRPHEPAAGQQHEREPERRLADREPERARPEVRAAGGDGGRDREEQHEREVLEQKHAEREPAVRAVDLGLLGQLLHHDRGRGHCDRAADDERDLGPRTSGNRDRAGRQGRERDL